MEDKYRSGLAEPTSKYKNATKESGVSFRDTQDDPDMYDLGTTSWKEVPRTPAKCADSRKSTAFKFRRKQF